jgi:integrase
MSIYRDKKRGCFVFDFSRTIENQRVRTTKSLPGTWNQAQADAYDRQESARLYAVATRVTAPDYLIEQAVEKYLVHRCKELKHGKGYGQELQALQSFYMGRPLSSLVDVCKAIKIKHAHLKPATVMNKIRYLTAACRYAWKHYNMGTTDPGAGVTVPTVKNARDVYLTRANVVRLAWACKDKPTRATILIAFYSGMRLGEILRAEIVGTAFVLRDTKNGSPRIVPIHPKLFAFLGHKYPSRFKQNYQFNKARDAVGMPWLHFHDLRHSAASAMLNDGVDMDTIGAVLGHKSHASTKRYSHLSTDRMAAAIFKIGRKAA